MGFVKKDDRKLSRGCTDACPAAAACECFVPSRNGTNEEQLRFLVSVRMMSCKLQVKCGLYQDLLELDRESDVPVSWD